MDLRPVLGLLGDGDFHSGQALGRRLGLSRSAVWKQIRRLRELGVLVHSVTGRGYCLHPPLCLLDADRIRTLSLRLSPAMPLEVHLSIDSTNAEAMRRAEKGAAPQVIFAEHQSQGRGRRGRHWVSPLGHNIYMSMVYRFEQGVAALEGLSLVTALAVVAALAKQSVVDLAVKWPNDVLLDGRKLAGILLEMRGDVSGPCVVVIGIGVNTHLPPSAAIAIDQPYAELGDVAGEAVDRNRLAAALIDTLLAHLDEFSRLGFAPFRQRWLELDHYRDQLVEVRSAEHVTVGRVCGVDDHGRLLLADDAGVPLLVAGGELFPSVRALR